MKDGERLVWAAAFAQVMADIDFTAPDALERMGEAAGRAYTAVLALRRIADVSTTATQHQEAWAMLRDMAGLSH